MKPVSRALAAAALCASLFATGASAATPDLLLTGGTVTDLTPSSVHFDPNWMAGFKASDFDLHQVVEGATLHLNGTANLTYTFVGKEAGYTNVFKSFYSGYGGAFQQIEGATGNLGQSISFTNVVNSALHFGFLSNGVGSLFKNTNENVAVTLSSDKKSALIFFNDACACDKDYDDMVVRVSISPVPEPETFGMLLAGLGLMGAVVRRRRTNA